MIEFIAAFSLGAGYTVALMGITLAFARSGKPQQEAPKSNLYVTKEEFDMLCRIVHDMAREDTKHGA